MYIAIKVHGIITATIDIIIDVDKIDYITKYNNNMVIGIGSKEFEVLKEDAEKLLELVGYDSNWFWNEAKGEVNWL